MTTVTAHIRPRPRLRPALLPLLWRGRDRVQLGLDPERAVVLGPLTPPEAHLITRLDGSHDVAGLEAFGARIGVPALRTGELLRLLTSQGLVECVTTVQGRPAQSADERERLRPDRAACALLRGAQDGGEALVARRAGRVVSVHGAGRVGAAVACLLAAGGVGTVVVTDRAPASPRDASPAGFVWRGLRTTRAVAARDAVRRASAAVRTRMPRGREHADVTVVVPEGRPDPELAARLTCARAPHLFADVRETTGLVGPFVLPGRSPCARCLDLHRTDRDPQWPLLLAQLAGADARPDAACDVALATSVAARAALQVLMYLDGDLPTAVGRTLESRLPDGRERSRTWAAHPRCDCGRAARGHGHTWQA